MIQIGEIVGQLRADGHEIDDETLSHVTPLLRKHINPFGRYHFDLDRIQKTPSKISRESLTEVFGWMWLLPRPAMFVLPV